MKLKVSILFVLFSTTIIAQESKHEIGIELSPLHGRIVPNINYLFSINEFNQLDFTTGLGFGQGPQSGFIQGSFSAYYKRKFNIVQGLNWYIGPGASVKYGRISDPFAQRLTVGVGMQVGLEYDFSKHNVPLIFGMDVKPEYNFSNSFNYFDLSPAFSLRFKF